MKDFTFNLNHYNESKICESLTLNEAVEIPVASFLSVASLDNAGILVQLPNTTVN
jgi:hypothetical protein